MRLGRAGFTLIELLIVVVIIAILTTIGMLNYATAMRKSEDGVTKGNLGALRSAVAIYYTDNDGVYPTDDLSVITASRHCISSIPVAHILPSHAESTTVTLERTPSDTGGWSYNNTRSDPAWGTLRVGCLHQDSSGMSWTTY